MSTVLLSPSGLSATLTGHTYTVADDSVRDIMEEWKLFYPKMVFPEYDSDLPLAVEVVLGTCFALCFVMCEMSVRYVRTCIQVTSAYVHMYIHRWSEDEISFSWCAGDGMFGGR